MKTNHIHEYETDKQGVETCKTCWLLRSTIEPVQGVSSEKQPTGNPVREHEPIPGICPGGKSCIGMKENMKTNNQTIIKRICEKRGSNAVVDPISPKK